MQQTYRRDSRHQNLIEMLHSSWYESRMQLFYVSFDTEWDIFSATPNDFHVAFHRECTQIE